ncbi:MAG: EamA family transporter [candidate division SR1 bacterium]|nr:EamA family transporter [candidate division SR1 bacterium]
MDKYLLSKFFQEEKNLSILLIFSSIVGIVLLPFIFFFADNVFAISTINKLLMIGGGIIYILSIIPYLYALNKDDASTVVPLFQMIAPISLILGYFLLGESLNTSQFIGFFIIFISSFFLSLDITHKIKFKYQVFLMMLGSCILISLKYIIFKRVDIQATFWTTAFWEYIGFGLVSILLLCIPGYAKSFLRLFKKDKYKIIGLNAANEIFNVGGLLIMNYVSVITLVGLAQLMNGFQPIFVFIYGIILTLLFPKIVKEKYSKTIIIQKIICFALMIFGLYLL